MDLWREFHGPNAGYVLELYEQYRRDPQSVAPAIRSLFAGWTPPPEDGAAPPAGVAAQPAAALDGDLASAIAGAANLAAAIRGYGHLSAHLDPLGSPPPGDPRLDPAFYGLSEATLRQLPAAIVGGPIAASAGDALEAITALRAVYSGSLGYDYDHVRISEEREWLREMAESRRFRPPHDPIDPRPAVG